ncbi:MAG: hypothetical protein ACREQ5_41265 [Candidatus Dormibacteria bacterium]
MSECPQCGNELRTSKTSCSACGWAKGGERSQTASEWNRFRCHWQASGERCRYAGTVSNDIRGGGPWYCWEHHVCDDMPAGAAIVSRSLAEIPPTSVYDGESIRARSKAAYLRRRPPEVSALEKPPSRP